MMFKKLFCLLLGLVLLSLTGITYGDRISIAVLDMDAKGEGLSRETADAITENIRYRFSKQDSINLVAREKMLELTKEKAIQLSGCTDISCAVQIGKALNVQKMVMGSVVRIGSKYCIYLKIVDVEKENVESTEKEETGEDIEELDRVIPALTERLNNTMWVTYGRKLIREDPNNYNSHIILGMALIDQSKYEEAEGELLNALVLKPDNYWIKYVLGILNGKWGRSGAAKRYFREAITLKPEFSRAHRYLGFALSEEDSLDEAERELRLAVSLESNSSVNHLELGEYLLNKKRAIKEAEDEYRSAIRLDPNLGYAHIKLGSLLFYEYSKMSEAYNEFLKGIKEEPEIAEAHYGMGCILFEQGKYKESEKEFREALRLEPKVAEPHYHLGQALFHQEKYQEAEGEFLEALQNDPNNTDILGALGITLDTQNKRRDARFIWEKTLLFEKDPERIKMVKKRLKEK